MNSCLVHSSAMSISGITGIPRSTVVRKLNKLLKKKIIHLSNNKRLSIYSFMKKISFIINKPKNVVAVKDSFFNNKYNKPKNLGLKSNVENFKCSNLYKFVYDYK